MFKVDDEYGFLTKNLLEDEYLQNGLTDKQIAEKYNIGSKATVWRRRKHYDIKNKVPTKSNQNAKVNRKFVVSKEEVLKWQSEAKTYDEMAKIAGCSRMVLYRRIKELGLTDECPEAMKRLKWHEELSDNQIKFILGDLLGDGSITPWGMYQCNHSHKQKAFIQHKADLLSHILSPNFELKERIVDNHQNGKQYRTYYLRTMANKILKDIYSEFYKNGEKIFPIEYLQNAGFDANSLAAWYMGDGSNKRGQPHLFTYGFGYSGNLRILEFLHGRFDIKGDLKETKGRPANKGNYITFKGENVQKFFSLVAPYMIPHFSYKLPEEYRFYIKK
ncbi:MAG: hypothetical protein WC119_01945 [Synergistaceae bacterium]